MAVFVAWLFMLSFFIFSQWAFCTFTTHFFNPFFDFSQQVKKKKIVALAVWCTNHLYFTSQTYLSASLIPYFLRAKAENPSHHVPSVFALSEPCWLASISAILVSVSSFNTVAKYRPHIVPLHLMCVLGLIRAVPWSHPLHRPLMRAAGSGFSFGNGGKQKKVLKQSCSGL